MIKVVKKENVIEITGHSNYDIVGKDIVCSAVSSIVTTTINGIISIDKKAISYKYKDDTMTISIIKNDEITVKLINNMLDLLISLSKDYPKNINVKES
jgi:uncharacterized protein YsxB (DUF464 family)